MKRNWKSPRLEADAYRKLTEVNWMAEYRLMYLKQLKLVTSAALPSLNNWLEYTHGEEKPRCAYRITSGTHRISKTREVNGAATDASASDREIPTSAALSAPQSFAPSPQKPAQ